MQVIERRRGVPQRKLEKSGRITPREVLEAYEETGFQPVEGVFVEDDMACAVGVLMWRDGAWPTRAFNGWEDVVVAGAIRDWCEERMGRSGDDYHLAFTIGFDGYPCALWPESDDRGWNSLRKSQRKGFADGRRARRFVFFR